MARGKVGSNSDSDDSKVFTAPLVTNVGADFISLPSAATCSSLGLAVTAMTGPCLSSLPSPCLSNISDTGRSVHVRHLKIHQDNRRFVATLLAEASLRKNQRLSAIVRDTHHAPLLIQRADQRVLVDEVVLNN